MLKCADPIEMPHFVASQWGLHKFAYIPFCGYLIKSGSKTHILWTVFKNTHSLLALITIDQGQKNTHQNVTTVDPEENAPDAL